MIMKIDSERVVAGDYGYWKTRAISSLDHKISISQQKKIAKH